MNMTQNEIIIKNLALLLVKLLKEK